MKRREFLITTTLGAGATVVLQGCGHREERLIPLLVSEEQLVPGAQYWTASVCRQCPAGCGIVVKTMLGEATTTVDGQTVRVKRRQAKKIEGNPDHPLNRGRLCARGQAGLQVLYNPDRLQGPLRRTGPRGSDQYVEITWEEAIRLLVERLQGLRQRHQAHALVFLTGRLSKHTRLLVERFMRAYGSPNHITYELFDDAVERRANELTMGREALATYDLARARYVLSFSAPFLETWRSPVYYSLGFGSMRQGRPGVRGKLVHVEPRFSLTAASADEWLPINPGTEGTLAMGLAGIIIEENLFDRAFIERHTRGFQAFRQLAREEYPPERVSEITAIPAETIVRLAREFAQHRPSLALGGGAAAAHTNGLFNLIAIQALNALVGNLGRPGGLSFTPDPPFQEFPPVPETPQTRESLRQPRLDRVDGATSIPALIERWRSGQPYAVDTLFLYEVNPLFTLPPALGVREALQKIPFIVSFSSFKDESAAWADLILPDHTYLESWWDEVPEPGAGQPAVGLAQPVVKPLYNTRLTSDVLLHVARTIGDDMRAALPWERFEDFLKEAYRGLHRAVGEGGDFEHFWEEVLKNGGWWMPDDQRSSLTDHPEPQTFDFSPALSHRRQPTFAGDERAYPFHLHIYPSIAFFDGRGANQPWLQEMPDPMTTVAWGSWVEIHPRTAEQLGVSEGDWVWIESPHGRIQAPVVLFPGARPDTVNIPVGQGHQAYGRYAKDRGANPVRLLTPLMEPVSGGLAWAATRVKVSKAPDRGRLVTVGYTRVHTEAERR